MRFLLSLVMLLLFISCKTQESKVINHNFSEVTVVPFFNDSVSIRAITISDDEILFAGSNNMYGTFQIDENLEIKNKKINTIDFEGKKIQFRSIASTKTDFFVLSIASPALLFKISKESVETKLVYEEAHEKVFYDAIAFWNDQEGIAMGDPTEDCLSIIITRDGGEHWTKISCDQLPKAVKGEAAFAASNGNIKIIGDEVWIVSGGIASRVFYSSDKGKTWTVFNTPIIQGKETSGAYSMDFYDKDNGIIFGGDYTKPEDNNKNKAITNDGGKTWKLVADGVGAGYKSCIRYIPNSGGKEMVTVGFTGISISNDAGNTWKELSNESFYTLRFINDSTAIAAGKNRIAKVSFK
ncbi:WD40/YVTN/BNR-like repeat-containing protein [Aquimarina litoralis]|uniref:WD40/YVTN/BNR-like repeat-containing protein n=1 Tax=Aquimarina litoralis TaxID=584605 RepID=UPI001C5A22CD|nr:oxidoreductase [Aquimarina litoralis]MBW1295728.1 oxidoreductase [Aquimarina litoralis]